MFSLHTIYAQDTETLAEDELTEEILYVEESEDELAFFIERSEEQIRFVQRLTWEPAEYTLRYEVTIEQLEEEGYAEILRESVTQPVLEVSLSAGIYRYKVDVYDLLNELAYESEWIKFEIKRALQPRISYFSPSAFYLDEDNSWIITLRGQNLSTESEIWLDPSSSSSASFGMFSGLGVFQSTRLYPRSVRQEGSDVRLEFSQTSLVRGEYFLYVRNPGGLDDTAQDSFVITNKKAFDINIYLGYSPLIPVHGYLFEDYRLEAPFPKSLFPLGASLKVNFIPFKLAWGSLGAEASISYTYLNNEKDNYSTKANFLNTHISFLYQRHFYNRKFTFNASIGLGLTSLIGFQYKYPIGHPADSVNAYYASFICGFSLSYFINQPYFIQAGIDFIQVLSVGENVPLPGFFRPFIGVGIRL